MIIEKILNNNVVVIHDEKGLERIVMGCGIAFQKKCGDAVDSSAIDKVFQLSSQDANHHFQELIVDIPMAHLELGEDIITYAKKHLDEKLLNDSIYISLVDHIYTAVCRYRDGIAISNALLWDIRRFYPDEFAIGMKALEIIEDRIGVHLPDDEAGFIAIHFVNARMEEDIKDVYEITSVMQEISSIVKYFFNVNFDEDSVYFYRFITHLKWFAQRLVHHKIYADQHDEDDLLNVIKVKYQNSYECVKKIAVFISEKYNYAISNEEKLYLTIHIERVIYKTER
ncbi:MAG: PRD domain-containing protein [Clostridiales Family XIII bacterium]|nr:PRD domain-containing protein [Clostridiales Family XIII bacterium]